jgi:hypothetical protein
MLQFVLCLYARCQGYSLLVNPNTKARHRPPANADSVATSRNMYTELSRISRNLFDRTPNPRYKHLKLQLMINIKYYVHSGICGTRKLVII